MARSFFRRLIGGTLKATTRQAGDVLAGEFAQSLWGGPVGFLKSKEKNGMGLVLWFHTPGRYEIIDTKHLRRAREVEK